MKTIVYKFCVKVNQGTAENPEWKELLTPTRMSYSEANLEIAKKEAYNGEYTIEDDGVEEAVLPTTEERLAAVESALLEMMGVTLND